MEFASKHVYLGNDEAEVDDDLLNQVESAGGLSNIVSAGYGEAPSHAQRRGSASHSSGSSDEDDEEAEGNDAPQQQQQQQQQSPLGAAAAPKKVKKPGFFARLFNSSASSSSSAAAEKDQRKEARQAKKAEKRERKAGMKSSAAPVSASLMNFFRSSAPAPPPPPPAAAAPLAPGARPDADLFAMPPPVMKKAVHRRAVDTNVLAVKFNTLSNVADELFAGDAILCEGCKAALNHLSTVVDHQGKRVKNQNPSASAAAPGGLDIAAQQQAASSSSSSTAAAVAANAEEPFKFPADVVDLQAGSLFWPCEFCQHSNVLESVNPAEIPTSLSRDYVIEPAPVSASTTDSNDEGYLVFVLDISGSMCSSSPVKGKVVLKGVKAIDPALLAFGDVDMSGVNSNAVTYISRLQSVQASIDAQFSALKESHPNKKVMLVTFNGEVTIVGDGTSEPVTITGDKLHQQAEITKIAESYPVVRSIGQSSEKLSEALFKLEETGATALGPALVVSIALASRQRGSQVVICTDGLANVGLGAMDRTSVQNKSDEEIESWYVAQGKIAKESGVVVNVCSIKGDECKLEYLGLVAAETGGSVDRIDPTDVEKNFKGMLSNPIIATNVKCTFFLHAGLQFRNDDAVDARKQKEQEQAAEEAEAALRKADAPAAAVPAPAPVALDHLADAASSMSLSDAAAPVPIAPALESKKQVFTSKLSRDVGNVYKDSEATLEYGLKNLAELQQYSHLKSLPFQVQIEFTTLKGMKALRVLTQSQPVTLDRAVAESGVKLELLSAQVAQRSAALAREGRYKDARMNWIQASPMLARVAGNDPMQRQTLNNFSSNIDEFDRHMASQQRLEERAEMEENERGGAPAAPSMAASSSSSSSGFSFKKGAMKKSKVSDETYRVLHKTHQLNSAGLM